ncbi:helix-turn-helix domain-containing protein [Brevibacillus laterosporus]|uniref:helix-turn-helix domain-containing protein n=1 Tax=Brevibacillus laterosporus TaxID=1465 RepID=UPI0018CE34BF|nr:helix-turn-helix transcriptional regulator [Brevibacillus laterosporus]MBG9789754.1 DNA-binding protein [Brevibacillus laterosporus]
MSTLFQDSMYYVTIGEIIRNYRQQANLSITQLAHMTGISKGVISKIENADTRRPELKTLKPLVEHLHIPYTEIIEAYLLVEPRLEILEELLEDALFIGNLQLVRKVALSYLKSPQEETDRLLRKLYEQTQQVKDIVLKQTLYDLMAQYARDHGLLQNLAQLFLQLYLMAQQKEADFESAFYLGKNVLFYAALLPVEQQIQLYQHISMHAYLLCRYDESILYSKELLQIAQRKPAHSIYAYSTLFYSSYALEDFQGAKEAFMCYSQISRTSSSEHYRLMRALLEYRIGNKATAIRQLKKCLTLASRKTSLVVVNQLIEIYLDYGHISNISSLLEDKAPWNIQPETYLEKRSYGHFYRLLGQYYQQLDEFTQAEQSYLHSLICYGDYHPQGKQECLNRLLYLYQHR